MAYLLSLWNLSRISLILLAVDSCCQGALDGLVGTHHNKCDTHILSATSEASMKALFPAYPIQHKTVAHLPAYPTTWQKTVSCEESYASQLPVAKL